MKRIIAAGLLLVIIAAVSILHSYYITSICSSFHASAEKIERAFEENDRSAIEFELLKIKQNWEDKKPWVSLTLPTKQIDEIDISLSQSIEYAKINAAPDFIGEFKHLSMKIEHLPKQEVISLEELL